MKRPKVTETMLYPGVMLRGGEMIVLQPVPQKVAKKSSKSRHVSLSARSVDKSVDMANPKVRK